MTRVVTFDESPRFGGLLTQHCVMAGPTALSTSIIGIDWSLRILTWAGFPLLPPLSLDGKSPTKWSMPLWQMLNQADLFLWPDVHR